MYLSPPPTGTHPTNTHIFQNTGPRTRLGVYPLSLLPGGMSRCLCPPGDRRPPISPSGGRSETLPMSPGAVFLVNTTGGCTSLPQGGHIPQTRKSFRTLVPVHVWAFRWFHSRHLSPGTSVPPQTYELVPTDPCGFHSYVGDVCNFHSERVDY